MFNFSANSFFTYKYTGFKFHTFSLHLLNTAIDAAAAFGSSQNRITGQSEFVQTLIDSMTTGIGSLTDTDMEAASAKLQALQVQQQLGVQALSIANQAPQTLLSLFR
ncbi:MAG: hypothetical protein B7Z22_05185 [Hyphomonas sp. 32-62-5]|nr:MAG: hypothetical protein B7Z22_05185 [Hyphomonas sp. 32-62-5]